MNIKVEFSGGLELLFNKEKNINIELDAEKQYQLNDLIRLLKEKHLRSKPELFVQDDSLRPGILVLINDTDWELEGGPEYILKNNDTISFISTLHGG